MQKVSSKIDSLQAIRGFAAIAVMLAHGTSILADRLGYVFLGRICMAGFSGVDVFFVLSGFIILHTSRAGHYTCGKFLKKRFIRIFPIYWVVTALLILAHLMVPSVEQSYKGDLGVILGSVFLWPQERYVVGVAWTLTYEVMFYLIFAITYFRNPQCLFWTFCAWSVLIVASCIGVIRTGIFAVNALLNPMILSFGFGCLLAYLHRKHPNFRYGAWFFWVGTVVFLAFCWLYYRVRLVDPIALGGYVNRVCMFGSSAAILIFGALYLPSAVPRWLVYLGDASYSLYLLHGTILSLLVKLILYFNIGYWFANFLGAIILFMVTVVLSCIFYSLVEKRLLQFLNRKLDVRKSPSA
jgi:exopolysaccharide production protein ExoZ